MARRLLMVAMAIAYMLFVASCDRVTIRKKYRDCPNSWHVESVKKVGVNGANPTEYRFKADPNRVWECFKNSDRSNDPMLYFVKAGSNTYSTYSPSTGISAGKIVLEPMYDYRSKIYYRCGNPVNYETHIAVSVIPDASGWTTVKSEPVNSRIRLYSRMTIETLLFGHSGYEAIWGNVPSEGIDEYEILRFVGRCLGVEDEMPPMYFPSEFEEIVCKGCPPVRTLPVPDSFLSECPECPKE